MRKHHPENERTKRRYVEYLKHARQLSEASIDQTVAAIADFEAVTGWRDFRKFRIELAQKYKRELGGRTNPKTGRPLSKATVSSRLMALKGFFEWLAGQPGFRSKLTYSDAEYFRPSANDERIAKAVREKPVASVEDIRKVLAALPDGTDIEKRDRALIAFALLSGARDNAIASLSLKHVDLDRHTVFQDARDVRTKNRKTFTTWFFPVGDDIEQIVVDWCALLKERGFGPDDPLFPATAVALGDNGFEAVGLARTHWKDAAAIRRIFKAAFARAGLPYVNPHSIRNTLVMLGERLCDTPEDFKAWSQNLGHEHVLTTFTSYGAVSGHRQAQIFDQLRARRDSLASSNPDDLDDETIAKVVARLTRKVT
ncbi:tyrosine-type recombinase/integrase [Devosia sp.]|uniref:tyrosine-type recombinase/integrase n=1 Tax=Devosia sp. TaxID=1871048 RepID=UPI002AFDD71C|nr:tyrosine-type recombinase/integrase [Devosia sp.]